MVVKRLVEREVPPVVLVGFEVFEVALMLREDEGPVFEDAEGGLELATVGQQIARWLEPIWERNRGRRIASRAAEHARGASHHANDGVVDAVDDVAIVQERVVRNSDELVERVFVGGDLRRVREIRTRHHDGTIHPAKRQEVKRRVRKHEPERIESGVASLDIIATARLDFEAPDYQRFPCLRLATEAARAGGTAMAVLNAANEVAVDAFLHRRVRFTDIPVIIEHVLAQAAIIEPETLTLVQQADSVAREMAAACIADQMTGSVAR